MKLIICGYSSLMLCSRLAAQGLRVSEPCRIRSLGDCISSAKDAKAVCDKLEFPALDMASGDDGFVHVLVDSANERYASKGMKRHCWSGPLPNGAFYRIGDGVYMTSPEFSLLLLSASLPFEDLLACCCEACGSYMRNISHPKGRFERPPLTSIKRLERFLEKAGTSRGTRKLGRALGYTLENARSPMESAIGLIMSLPTRIGGYGFPKPLLNFQVDFDVETKSMSGKKYVELDYYFSDEHVAVEYDSDEDHANAKRIASDARRGNTVRYLGYPLITITWEHVRTSEVFDGAMVQLARELGKSVRTPTQNILAARRHLRMCLLPAVQDR